jgi:hypothetical protein
LAAFFCRFLYEELEEYFPLFFVKTQFPPIINQKGKSKLDQRG